MASGIKASPDVQALFNDMKLHKSHKYVAFKIPKIESVKPGKYEFGQSIEIDTGIVGEPKATTTAEEDKAEWNKMIEILPPKEPRYLVYDFRYYKESGVLCEKLAAFLWCDDYCGVKDKMVYASSKDNLEKKLQTKFFDINDCYDLAYEQARNKSQTKN